MDAFARLWSQYKAAAYATAIRTTDRFDADDLVAEAYTRTLAAVRRGKGPQSNFPGYVNTAIRSISFNWARIAREEPFAEVPEDDAARNSPGRWDPALMEAPGESTIAHAFKNLPKRWQIVLWHSEVEGMSLPELAAVMGLTTTAAAALSYRARKGLRLEWEAREGNEPTARSVRNENDERTASARRVAHG